MVLYDYGNTRLRARISGLFSLAELEIFSELKSIDNLISRLSKTHYKKSIEIALTHAHDYGCIVEALRRELMDIHGNLKTFYDEEIWKKLRLIFLRIDLQNVKAIIRGVSHKIPVNDIIASLSPLGTISTAMLTQIAKSKDIVDAIDAITVYKLEFADELFSIKGMEQPYGASEIERIIETWYYNQSARLLSGKDSNTILVREMNAIETDIVNLNITLRYVNTPDSPELENHPIDYYLIQGGSLPPELLVSISSAGNVEDAVKRLVNERYHEPLLRAIGLFHENGLLSNFERELRLYALKWMGKLPKQNPFGIGVPIGYTALKKSEIRNIRWIAKGISSGFTPDFIKENFERIR